MRAFSPRPIISVVLSAFERRASARLLRRPRTGELATSAITRVSAEKLRREMCRSGYMRRSSGDDVLRCRHADPVHRVVRVERALRLPMVARTCQTDLTMSVDGSRAEVGGTRSNRRF